MYVSLIGLRLTKTRLTLINRTRRYVCIVYFIEVTKNKPNPYQSHPAQDQRLIRRLSSSPNWNYLICRLPSSPNWNYLYMYYALFFSQSSSRKASNWFRLFPRDFRLFQFFFSGSACFSKLPPPRNLPSWVNFWWFLLLLLRLILNKHS